VDKEGDVYFPQHGGNRISVIDNATGVMTEYEIPTGPLSTALFITASDDGKIWFTEWAANKIGYLDTNVKIPYDIEVAARDITLTDDESKSINISLKASGNNITYLTFRDRNRSNRHDRFRFTGSDICFPTTESEP
jgi:virginiamycin B lyase